MGLSLESCRDHLLGFRNLRSIAVTWQVWECFYNWTVYSVRERHLPNTIRCAILKPVDQLWDIISEDGIAFQILVQDPKISRSDIIALCAAIHTFIGIVIKDMTATQDCLRLDSGNTESQQRTWKRIDLLNLKPSVIFAACYYQKSKNWLTFLSNSPTKM